MKTQQKYVYLRPLTPAEADVAERNHYLVYKFLRARGLSPDEWYDVVVFRYLQTVIKWFEKPELYVYEFSTVRVSRHGFRCVLRTQKAGTPHFRNQP